MKSICAWCDKPLGERPGPEGKTTHGICPECMKKELKDFYEKRADRAAADLASYALEHLQG